MKHRSKSKDRIVDELRWLDQKYAPRRLVASDNILPHDYFKTVLPALVKSPLGAELFYEIKANLKRDQVRLLADAGVATIQPGIESLSTPALRHMRKGVSSLQNIQLLKWCREMGVRPIWNYLYGLPGETPEWYAKQASLMTAISHLPPPTGTGKIRFDRFSPYHSASETFGVRGLRAYPSYGFVYAGLSPAQVDRIAYYFVGEFDGKGEVDDYGGELVAAVAAWQEVYEHSALSCLEVGDGGVVIVDGRPSGSSRKVTKPQLRRLDGVAAATCLACRDIQPRSALSQVSSCQDELDATLTNLVDTGLLLHEGGSYLSLAVAAAARAS